MSTYYCPACGAVALTRGDSWRCDDCGAGVGLPEKGPALDAYKASVAARKERGMQAVSAAPILDLPPAEVRGLSKSYGSLCKIMRSDLFESEIGKIEWNALRQEPTVDRRPVSDADIGQIRERVENSESFRGVKNERLKFNQDETWRALAQVSSEHSFHPVGEYLESLKWDGQPRIASVAEDILGVEATALTQAILRRWFISAVARVLRPGCKADTVLILQGKQGARKSTFFETLAGRDWFSDSAIDLSKNDAPMVLRRVWILEWAELEAMQRARDANAVKQFITSRVDVYRPPYGRAVIDVPRTCVIVGTSNDEDILADPTGNRRYWILGGCDRVDTPKLAGWRDQLWAEAVVAFKSGEQWHLTDAEDAELARGQAQFEKRDPWEGVILGWVENPRRWDEEKRSWSAVPVTTANVLECAVRKPAGQWSARDASRVAQVFRAAGWVQGRPRGANRVRAWSPGTTGSIQEPLSLKVSGTT